LAKLSQILISADLAKFFQILVGLNLAEFRMASSRSNSVKFQFRTTWPNSAKFRPGPMVTFGQILVQTDSTNFSKFRSRSTQPNLAKFQTGWSQLNFISGPTTSNLAKILVEADSVEFDQGLFCLIWPHFGLGQLGQIWPNFEHV